MNNCQRTKIACTKMQYREANFLEKLRTRIHLLLCYNCKTAVKSNQKLTRLCREANFKVLPTEEKEEMKKRLRTLELE